MLSDIPKQWRLLTAIIMPNWEESFFINKYLFTIV